MNDNFKIQMIAAQALDAKYGFCPATEQVKLLESDGEGTYILFRIGEHEYRFEDGELTNIEDQKKLNIEADTWLEIHKMQQTKIDELKSQLRWQERKTKLAEIEKRTLAKKIEKLQAENAAIQPLKCTVEWLKEEREKVDTVLNNTRAEALHAIENKAGSYDCRMAWFHCHKGEIEMAWFLGLIPLEKKERLAEEWKSHKPAA